MNETNIEIKQQESVIHSIDNALFLDKEKIKKLGGNILSHLNRSEHNAMTIGIVGEWGSGKSSFLNILLGNIKEGENTYHDNKGIEIEDIQKWIKIENKIKSIKLEKSLSNIDECKVIFINSWLINNIISNPLFNLVQIIDKELELNIDQFDNINNKKDKGNLFKKVISGTKNIVNKGLDIVRKSEIGGVTIDITPFGTIYDDLIKMKEVFNGELTEKLGKDKSKLIIVIDDLDRIPPEDAVTILDSIKLFLDNPNILIFLLNDKKIIERGLKKKLELTDDLESKKIANSYLDKLINIEIDITKYYNNNFEDDIKKFVKSLNISKIGSEFQEKLLNDATIKKLKKIGNMRRIKKIFNTLEIQGPSIVKESSIDEYVKYCRELIDEYINKMNGEKMDKNKDLEI